MANEISNANAPSVVDSSGNPVENATIIAVKQKDVDKLSQSQATEIQAIAKLTDVNGDFTFTESELYLNQNQYAVVALKESGEERATPNYSHVDASGPFVPDSAVLHYKFDNSNSDTSIAVDSEGTNNGTIISGSYTADSKVGANAIDLTGSSGRVAFSDNDYLENNDFTITFWVKLNNKPSDTGYFISPVYDGNVHPTHIVYDNSNFTPSEQPLIRSFDGNDDAVGLGSTLSTGTWTFLAFSLDWSNGDVQIWKDGGGTPDTTGTLGNLTTHGKGYDIGGFNNQGSFQDKINAYLDDVIIFDGILSDSEVTEVYERSN